DFHVTGVQTCALPIWQVVVVALENAAEAGNGVFQRHVLARRTGEDFGHEERLGQEALNLTSARYQLLVLFGQLVHTQDGDDVLQFLVALQHVLHAASHFVVLLANYQRIQRTAGGVQRVNGRVDTQGSDVTRQYDGGVQVGEGGRRARVGQVVRGNVYGLDRGDRTGLS